MNEMIIKQQSILECDFEGIKKHVADSLDFYSKVVFTEETKKDAKNTVADLRKEKKELADQVKALKKEYMKPFDEFNAKVEEILDLYDKPIIYINGQIEAFEEQRKQEKIKQIEEIYDELVPEEDLRQYIALKSIYNAKWENATFTTKAIKEEIMECKIKAKEAIEVIKSMGSEKQDEAIEMYKLTRDLTECLKFIQRYEAQKREILEREEARRKQEEEERIRREERARIEAENQRKEDEQRHQEALQEAQEEARNEFIDSLIPEEVEGENEVVYTYDIKLTDSKKEALELFMNSVGIEYDLITLPM